MKVDGTDVGVSGHRSSIFKWIFKSILAQVGCLSGQSAEDDDSTSDDNRQYLIEDTAAKTWKGKKKPRVRKDPVYSWEEGVADDDCWEAKGKAYQPMFSLQNCTLQSEDRGDGETYWVSFEEKSFSKGNEFKVYNGRMNGAGPKSGDRCVVKVFRQCQGTKSLCSCEVKKSLKAKEIARAFRKICPNQASRIKIATVYWALMDEVSKLKLLFFTGERKLSTREAVLFEDDVRINDEKPGKPKRLTLYMSANGEGDSSMSTDLEAFVHFSYHSTMGKLVICGLEGVHDEDGYFLKTPTIHSEAKEFGNKDQGRRGIQEVFKWHKCNQLCQNMLKPDLSDITPDSSSPAKCPVATEFPFSMEPRLSLNDNCNPPCKLNHPSQSVITRQSEATECMSGYLEPSAPAEDLDEDVFIPQPPPYSERSVANWLLMEQAPNCFIPPVPEEILRNRMEAPLDNVNEMIQDLNANFTDGESDGGVSNTPSGEDRTCVQFDKKKVRFSLFTSSSSANDAAADTSTSGFSSQPQSIIKHPSATAFNPVAPFSPHLVSPTSCTSETTRHIFSDSPPSYYDSEMSTAFWIVQRGYLPVHSPASSALSSSVKNDSCNKTAVAAVITPNGQVANFFPVAVNDVTSTSL